MNRVSSTRSQLCFKNFLRSWLISKLTKMKHAPSKPPRTPIKMKNGKSYNVYGFSENSPNLITPAFVNTMLLPLV